MRAQIYARFSTTESIFNPRVPLFGAATEGRNRFSYDQPSSVSFAREQSKQSSAAMVAGRSALSRFFFSATAASVSGSSSARNGSEVLRNAIPSRVSPSIIPWQLVFSRGVASKLFVGGLSFYTTEEALSEAFSQYGQVIEAKVIMDKVSRRSKGFGFVTFASEEEAQKAVAEMNGKILGGRVIFVDSANKRKPVFDDARPIARGPPKQDANE